MTQIEAILYKNKYEPFADCSNFVVSEVLNWDSISELYLTVPDELNSIQVMLYNQIRKNRFIVVDDTRRYIITEITTVKNQNISEKQVKAYSVESLLENINIDLEENTPYFFTDITRLITELTGWKFDIQTKKNLNSTCYSVAGNYKVLTLLRETLQYLYDVHFDFDTIHNKIIVTSRNDRDYSIYGDFDNLLQTVIVNDTDKIVTRLLNKDESCAIFAEDIKLAGKEYVEDFSYYINNSLISSDLIRRLSEYDEFLETKKPAFTKLQNNLFKLNSDLKDTESKIEALESVDTGEEEKDTEQLARLESKKADLEESIKKAEDSILSFTENITREKSGLFSAESLLELSEIIVEEDYTSSNDAERSSNERYNNMVRKLKQINESTFEYTLDITTVKHITEKLGEGAIKLGSIFYFSQQAGVDNLRLIGYTHDYVNNDINSLIFANSLDQEVDKLDFFGQLVDETKRLQRKTNNIKITVERLENGFKSQVTKGEFYTAITQAYDFIEGETRSDAIASKVRLEADNFNISIDGKLKGTKYEFNGENAVFYGAGLIVKNDKGSTVLYIDDNTGLLTCNALQVLNGTVDFRSPNDSKSLFVNFYRGSSKTPSRIGIYAKEGNPTGTDRGNQLFIEPSNPDVSKTPMVIFRGARSTKTENQACIVQIIGELQAQEMQLGFADDAINIRATLADLKTRVAELEAKLT